jgi:dual 3',5'-cyclic-AMP and -GMP phosphodiesterase 11
MFETYLQFVGIAITNAQIMEASREEYERNRVIFIENLTKYIT